MVGKDLSSTLGFGLASELDEDAGNLFVTPGVVFGLGTFGSRNQALELHTTPVDRVNLLAEQAQKTSSVGWAFLVGNPAGSNAPRFSITERLGGLGFCGRSTLLEGILTLLVCKLDQLDLGPLKLVGDLITLLDGLVQLLGVASDPDVLNRGSKDLAQLGLVKVGTGHRSEENSAGRNSAGVKGAEQESLAKVDIKDALSHDHVHDETVVSPADEDMGIVSVVLGIAIDIAIGKDIELLFAPAACCVDRKENRPGDAAADEADDGGDAQKANKEVGVEGLVLKRIDVGDLPKCAKPVEEAIREGRRPFTAERVSKQARTS